MIIRSGFKVYPQEVEAVLNAFPTVLQSAVVGRRAADGNEEVIAFLELRPRCTLDRPALDRWLKDRLASYKRPAQLICLPLLPATASGKIRKSELPGLAAQFPVRF
jgi:acyl-coenzyme A synthetase/AMP-(fatty) acid ligase